jgi:hypothetical protein
MDSIFIGFRTQIFTDFVDYFWGIDSVLSVLFIRQDLRGQILPAPFTPYARKIVLGLNF